MIKRKARIGSEIPQWFEDMERPSLVGQAIWAGGVLFPGDERVTFDRAGSSVGPVSSRTRQASRTPDKLGLYERNSSKYDAEGMVMGQITLKDVRWDESRSTIECRIISGGSQSRRGHPEYLAGRPEEESWEQLTAISHTELENGLYKLMQSFMLPRNKPPRDLVKDLTERPSPRDIINVSLQYGLFDWDARVGSYKLSPRDHKWSLQYFGIMCRNWAILADRWETRLAKAEEDVVVEDLKAERRAAKVARAAAKAEAKEARAVARAERKRVNAEKAKAKEERAKARAEKAAGQTRAKARAKRS